MRRFIAFFFVFSTLITSGLANADEIGRKMMGAAAVVLSTETFDAGDIQVLGPDLARSSKGVIFRRLAPCTFGMAQPVDGQASLIIIDFAALTGGISRGGNINGYDLVLEGRSPRTRCFDIAGQQGCQTFVKLPAIDEGQERRVLDDLRFMRRNGCAPPSDERDPY